MEHSESRILKDKESYLKSIQSRHSTITNNSIVVLLAVLLELVTLNPSHSMSIVILILFSIISSSASDYINYDHYRDIIKFYNDVDIEVDFESIEKRSYSMFKVSTVTLIVSIVLLILYIIK